MKKTLQDQYLLIKEGKGHKGVFLTEAKHQFPNIVRNAATFEEASASLITKNIISENVIGLTAINSPFEPKKKESYESAFEAFLAEAKKKNEDEKVKAEEKKVSKPVEKDLSHNYNNSDDKNPDNLIFDQIMMGYYAEMKDPKNAEKTMQQLKDIVFKNLAKDPIYYTKNAQFGVKDLGYTTEHPGLGTPKEAKGKFKSSGYGDLNEGLFSPKPLGNVEGAKEDIKKAMVVFLQKNTNLKNADTFTDKELLKAIEGFARYGESETTSNTNRIANQIYKVAKPLFEEESLEESKLRKVIREIISEELEEIINIRPSKSGGGGRRFIPTDYTLSAMAVNRINTLGENSLGWGKPHIILGDDGKIKISALLYKDLENQERGRTSRDKESSKSPLGRVIGEIDQNSKDALRIIRKNVAPSIGDDKYFESVMPKNTTTLTKTDRETGEKREVLGSITVDAKTDIEELLLRESVEKDLADINKEAEYEVLQSKLDKIDALIDKRRSQLGKLDEDEDMKALTDKKKVKELERDIKKLEVARKKVEKMLSKTKGKKKEILDEVDEDETDMGLMKAVSQAQEMYNGGLDIEDILIKFNPRMRDDIESYLIK
jgi:hypothetical protein